MTTPTPGQPLSEADVKPFRGCLGEAMLGRQERLHKRNDLTPAEMSERNLIDLIVESVGEVGDYDGPPHGDAHPLDTYRPHAPVSRPGDGVEGVHVRAVQPGWGREFDWLWLPDGDKPDEASWNWTHLVRSSGESGRERAWSRKTTLPTEPVSRPAGEGEREAVAILKGVGKINGDGWKDTTTKGEVVFVWNAEKPSPYAPGQYPRIGNGGWSASTSQYDFTPATADDVPAILSLLRPAAPDAGGGSLGPLGKEPDSALKIATDLHAAYEQLIYGLPKYLEAENLTDEENMIREAYITLDVTAHRLSALQPGGER